MSFPTSTDRELWSTLLWCSTDDDDPMDSNYSIDDVCPDDAAKLNEQYWQWRESADQIMIEHGLGELSLDDLMPGRVEHCYVLAREGHGVSMADDWLPSPEHACCKVLDRAARQQGPIGPYVGDSGKIYLLWSE